MKYWTLCAALSICAPLYAEAPNLLLAKEYQSQNVQGWVMSEKLDGVRAYWNGKQLISRQGYAFTPSAGFLNHFPPFAIDGELYAPNLPFERISAITRQSQGDWSALKLYVFDVPQAKGNLYQRLDQLQKWLKQHPKAAIQIIKQTPINSIDEAKTFLAQVEKRGGEGVMLRNPDTPYQAGRSNQLLKLKSQHDAECRVTQHIEGKGKYQGKMGAILCQNHLGTFKIGSGFKDSDRANPPPIGSIITYRYRGFTKKGLPRFATYWRVRSDKK